MTAVDTNHVEKCDVEANSQSVMFRLLRTRLSLYSCCCSFFCLAIASSICILPFADAAAKHLFYALSDGMPSVWLDTASQLMLLARLIDALVVAIQGAVEGEADVLFLEVF